MSDERDQEVSRRYRELGAEEPPRALDDAILSAARQAADKPHAPLVTPVGRHRWYYGVAAAAVVVLAVAVTLHVERQQPDESPALPAPAAPPAEVKAPAPTQPPAEKKAVAAPKPKPRFAPDPPPATTGAAQSRSADAVSAPRERAEAAAEAPAMARSSSAASAPAATPEQELERIAQLRRQEKHEEADRALAEFRRRYPDYVIAPALRERVERK